MMQMHTWCPYCETISVVEAFDELPTARGVRESMIRMAQKEFDTGEFNTCSLNPDRDALAADRRRQIDAHQEYGHRIAEYMEDIRSNRTLPQRCLRCGRTEIELPNDDCVNLSHDPCPGTLKYSGMIGGVLFKQSEPAIPHVYNIDGELLEIGRMPPDDGEGAMPLWWPIKWDTWRPL